MTSRNVKGTVLYQAIIDFLNKPGSSLVKSKDSTAKRSSSSTPNPVHQVGRTLFLFRYLSIMNIIGLAAIVNISFPVLKTSTFEFSFMYLIILIYGITLPIMASLYLYWQIASKAVDKEYGELIKEERRES